MSRLSQYSPREIDLQRESYIGELFKLHDFSEEMAQSRARFLYWAYFGRMLSLDYPYLTQNIFEVVDITQLFLQKI
jgi:hypothetical protein